MKTWYIIDLQHSRTDNGRPTDPDALYHLRVMNKKGEIQMCGIYRREADLLLLHFKCASIHDIFGKRFRAGDNPLEILKRKIWKAQRKIDKKCPVLP